MEAFLNTGPLAIMPSDVTQRRETTQDPLISFGMAETRTAS